MKGKKALPETSGRKNILDDIGTPLDLMHRYGMDRFEPTEQNLRLANNLLEVEISENKKLNQTEINDNSKKDNNKFHWKSNQADIIYLFEMLKQNEFIDFPKNFDKIISQMFDVNYKSLAQYRQQLNSNSIFPSEKIQDFISEEAKNKTLSKKYKK